MIPPFLKSFILILSYENMVLAGDFYTLVDPL